MLVMALIDENVTPDMIPDGLQSAHVAVGGPEQIAEQIKTKVLDAGIDGVILNHRPTCRDTSPGRITAVG